MCAVFFNLTNPSMEEKGASRRYMDITHKYNMRKPRPRSRQKANTMNQNPCTLYMLLT